VNGESRRCPPIVGAPGPASTHPDFGVDQLITRGNRTPVEVPGPREDGAQARDVTLTGVPNRNLLTTT
jgi:hypothetical protein